MRVTVLLVVLLVTATVAGAHDHFNDKRLFRGATRNLRLVERFTRRESNTIDYQLTVTDPATFSTPWILQNALRKGDGRL